MNEFRQQNDFQSLTQLLKDTLNHHFGEYFKGVVVDLDENLIPIACVVIEYLIYYNGNSRRMQSNLQERFPDLITSVLQHKFIKENEMLENANRIIEEQKVRISTILQVKSSSDQQIYYFKAENERLQKLVDQQNRVLRNLQDRLDGVNNSGQQIG